LDLRVGWNGGKRAAFQVANQAMAGISFDKISQRFK
jgi:hypothetical protein